ncbi:hypothetical protein YC2023_119312 [Brassica napus]
MGVFNDESLICVRVLKMSSHLYTVTPQISITKAEQKTQHILIHKKLTKRRVDNTKTNT